MKTLEEYIREKMAGTTQPRELSDVQMDAVTAAVTEWHQSLYNGTVYGGDCPSIWDASIPPGGQICSVCGTPTESEPCEKHQPLQFARIS
jgi:hypothetical protein